MRARCPRFGPRPDRLGRVPLDERRLRQAIRCATVVLQPYAFAVELVGRHVGQARDAGIAPRRACAAQLVVYLGDRGKQLVPKTGVGDRSVQAHRVARVDELTDAECDALVQGFQPEYPYRKRPRPLWK